MLGPGIFLAVVGAILAFAVRADVAGFNVQIAGLILLIAGAGLIWHARRGTSRERVITRVEDPSDPAKPPRTIEERIIDRDVE